MPRHKAFDLDDAKADLIRQMESKGHRPGDWVPGPGGSLEIVTCRDCGDTLSVNTTTGYVLPRTLLDVKCGQAVTSSGSFRKRDRSRKRGLGQA